MNLATPLLSCLNKVKPIADELFSSFPYENFTIDE